MATPALRALQKLAGKAGVIAVGRPAPLAVLEGSGLVDETIATGARNLPGIWTTSLRLRQSRPAMAALLSNSFRVALMATIAGCRERVGMAMHGRGMLLTRAVQPELDNSGSRAIIPALIDYNRIAIACGAESPDTHLELGLTDRDAAAAAAVYAHPSLVGREIVILNPGAAFGAAKFWPAESFARLAGMLADTGRGVLVLCGPAEAELARTISRQANKASVVALPDLSGDALSLGLSKACVARSALLITTDSGPRHFAHAFRRPVITLFGPTHIGWTETWHAGAVHIQKPLPCGPCQKRACPMGHHLCMKSIDHHEVFDVAIKSLASAERLAG
jgi:heptosyltransferase-2